MAAERHCKLLIIGSGPAGYTAAIYAARANLAPLLVQGLEVGGQLSITTDVENYPGFADVIQGPWLMEQMAGQATACGAELIFDSITAVDLGRRPVDHQHELFAAEGGEELLVGGEGLAIAVDPDLDRVVDVQSGELWRRRQRHDEGGGGPQAWALIQPVGEAQRLLTNRRRVLRSARRARQRVARSSR